ncbi:MAG: chloride channel protein [Polyangiales bacterium]|nr:chloride channel protein [Myxococcales bacterium]MCB9658472.1 chloride channel protein [Sandaracinaceae bacterium]
MAGKHFESLDDEARALHDSWDSIVRIVLLVAMLTILVWGACTLLRLAVHFALHVVLEAVTPKTWEAAAILLLSLTGSGIVRGLLAQRAVWQSAFGDGMGTALSNYHVTYDHEGDDPQPRYERPAFALAARKFVTTLLTIGSGASGGLEAPVVMMGEAVSAGFARVLAVRSEHELRTYQLAGIAAAVSTLLGAPFTAALFATEVAYGDRIIYRKLAYCLWAGVIAFWLNGWLSGGYEPLFVGPAHSEVYSIAELGAAALVAVTVSVPVAFGFGKAMVAIEKFFAARVRSGWHAVVSALGTGIVALALSYAADLSPAHVLGMGERTLSGILAGDAVLATWWMLLLVLVGKTITTGLTMAGSGSAGLLVPSMYLGGVSGALVAHLANLTGWTQLDPALFAVVGLGSSLVAVIGVPLAAIALVLEVFGKSFGPPAILACGVTYLLTLKFKLYDAQRSSPTPTADETGG